MQALPKVQPDPKFPRRILIVDDEPEPLRAAARVLRRAGYDVSTAEDGQGALTGLSRGRFDAVVSDISMPGMDGIALLRSIRDVDPEVPVILLTGVPAIETAVQALDHGAYKYLVKPINPEQLVDVAAKAVRLAASRRDEMEPIPSSKRLFHPTDGLSSTLELALTNIRLVFQPIVKRDGALFGHEALMRCNLPQLVNPEALIEMANSLHRLEELGRTARRLASAVFTGKKRLDTLFVNIHPSELYDGELLNPNGALTPHAPNIVLEITERASVRSMGDLQQRVAELRAAGYRIAIDDLGAGYAGLSSFIQLEPDVVKVDMSLVRDVDQSKKKQRLIENLVQLCGEMGTLVVEGVETTAERDALFAVGCRLMQGYLFARPAPNPEPAVF